MQTIHINLIPKGINPTAYASQGDINRLIAFVLLNGDASYEIPSGAVVSVSGTKPDGKAFSYLSSDSDTPVSFDGDTVVISTKEQMTVCAGIVVCELKIVSGGTVLHTLNFNLDVEASALPADADLSKSDIPIIEQAINAGESAAASAKEAAASAKEAAASAKEAAQSITGVSSWNGRTGAVKPQSGDYTAAMVGALASSDVTSTYSATGTAPVNGKAIAAAVKDKADTTYVDKADAALNTRLTSAEGTIASQDTRLTSAEGTIASQDTRLTSAENSISKLTGQNIALDIYPALLASRKRVSDLNDATANGIYTWNGATNTPASNNYGILLVINPLSGSTDSSRWILQIASLMNQNDPRLFIRKKINTNDWSDWHETSFT